MRDLWNAVNDTVQAINALSQILKGAILTGPQGAAGPAGAAGSAGTPGTPGVIPRSYLAGLTLSNDGGSPFTVLDIAAGQATDTTGAVGVNLGALNKSTSGSWVSGSGHNGMGQGLTIAASTWYHVILANNGGTPDVYFDTSVTGANRPAGITDPLIRRIGSFKTDGSSNVLAFSQLGDEFIWATPINDVNTAVLGTVATSFTLSVPTGVVVWARIRGQMTNAIADTDLLLTSLVETAQPPNTPVGNRTMQNRGASVTSGTQGTIDIRTNTSAQIRAVAGNTSTTLQIATYGWIDRRGRDA